MLLNYIIIDPNPIQRIHLLQFFKKIQNLKLNGEFSNAIDAQNYLKYNKVDLIFLSAKLPVYSGFEFIEKLCDPNEIILLTEQPQDALRAYEIGLTDCIAPPFTLNRIEKAVERVVCKINNAFEVKKEKSHIIEIKHNLTTEKIPASGIKWVEAMGDYVKIITLEKKYIVLSTMKAFMEKLPENQFLRIHKSFIINLNKVVNYTSSTVNIDGDDLPISRNRKKDFREIISQI
jgi:DNA-binding LytR/AlgR family response regulator